MMFIFWLSTGYCMDVLGVFFVLTVTIFFHGLSTMSDETENDNDESVNPHTPHHMPSIPTQPAMKIDDDEPLVRIERGVCKVMKICQRKHKLFDLKIDERNYFSV